MTILRRSQQMQRTVAMTSVGLLSLIFGRTQAYLRPRTSYNPSRFSVSPCRTASSISSYCIGCLHVRNNLHHSVRQYDLPAMLSSSSSTSKDASSALPPGPDSPTISAYQAWATKLFQDQGIPDAHASADYLLLHALNWPPSRSSLSSPSSSSSLIENEALATFLALCQRRLRREPVQYLVGQWDFHRITLDLRPPILIPRPETEELVEWVLEEVGRGGAQREEAHSLRFLDIGCGSGAIGLALLNALPVNAYCIGLDPNPTAIELSSHNAQRLGLANRYKAIETPIADYEGGGSVFDFIVANPPYIPEADMADLQDEVRVWEDEKALDGGKDGADIIRQILHRAPSLLHPQGLRKVWMEVDVSHPKAFENDRSNSLMPLKKWRRDLRNRPRFCCWEMKEGQSRSER